MARNRYVLLMGSGDGVRDLYKRRDPTGRETYVVRLRHPKTGEPVAKTIGDTDSMSLFDATDMAERVQVDADDSPPLPPPKPAAPIVRAAPVAPVAPVAMVSETLVDAELGIVRRGSGSRAMHHQIGRDSKGRPRERVLCTQLGGARILAQRPWPESV